MGSFSISAKFESELGTLERQIIEKDAKLKKLEEQCQHETALRKRSEQKAVEIVKVIVELDISVIPR